MRIELKRAEMFQLVESILFLADYHFDTSTNGITLARPARRPII